MQDIKEMNEELAQTNKNFREESELYRDKFEANCEMVRRFDEVMVLKASKVSLKDEIMQLDQSLLPKFRELTEEIDDCKTEFAN